MRDVGLADVGVRVEDRSQPGAGTGMTSVWKLEDAEVLRREREEKQAKLAEEGLKKAISKKAKLVRNRFVFGPLFAFCDQCVVDLCTIF